MKRLLFDPLLVVPLAVTVMVIALPEGSHYPVQSAIAITGLVFALLIAVLGWHSFPLTTNIFMLYVAAGFTWVAGISLFDLVSGIPAGELLAEARITQAATIGLAPLFLRQHARPSRTVLVFAALAVLMIAPRLFAGDNPAFAFGWSSVADEVSLVVCVAAAISIYRHRAEIDRALVPLLTLSLMLAAASYAAHLFGGMLHEALLSMFSYWAVLAAVIKVGMTVPIASMAVNARIYDAIPDPTVVVDESGNVYRTNRAARSRFGIADSRILGEHCHRYLHPADLRPDECPVCSWIRHPSGESRFELSFGERGPIHSVAVTVLNLPDGARHTIHVSRDITEERLAESAVRHSELRYRALMENASDGIVVVDQSGAIVDVNRRLARMLRYRMTELLTMNIRQLHRAEDYDRITAGFESLKKSGNDICEYLLLDRDGREIPVEIAGCMFRRANDWLMFGSIRDISERKRVETAIRRSEARSRAIFQHAGVGIQICSPDGRLVEVNWAFRSMVGESADDLRDRTWRDFVHEADHKIVSAHWPGQEPATFRVRLRRADGTLAWGETVLSAVKEGERVTLVIVMTSDVTDRQLAEERRLAYEHDLRDARAAAEEASLAKTRFLATASHDIRQPIQAIRLLIHLMEIEQLAPGQRALMEKITGAVSGLSRMLDTLLDISKLEAGLVVAEQRAFAIEPLMRELSDEFQPLAEAKGLRMRWVPSSAVVFSDPDLLARILRNLLTNAVRNTESGAVLLGCRRQRDEVCIEVVDTGVGIPDAELERVFDEFHQVGNKARNRREGLGLGLTIVDRLSRLLGHRLTLSSRVGHGTRIGLSVPLQMQAVRAADQLPLEMGFPGANILLVEDEEDIRECMSLILEKWEYRVMRAHDLASAVDCLERNGGADLVVADYRLGDVTGVELIREMRSRFGKGIPGVIITGDVQRQPSEEARAHGMLVANKPLDPQELRELVLDALTGKR